MTVATGSLPTPAVTGTGGTPAAVPLVVDLDGTFLRTDTLLEGVLALLARNPLLLFLLPLWLARGKAAFKARIADAIDLDPAALPVTEAVVDYLRREKAAGRRLCLATAADRRWAEAVAGHAGLFDTVFGSDATVNLRGRAKADRLCEAFGEGGFDYIGDAPVDVAVWARARAAVVVAASDTAPLVRAAAAVNARCSVIVVGRPRVADYLIALRPHQWLKNSLIFLPAVAGHAVTAESAVIGLLSFLIFGLCASGVYLVNDLVDLPHDRRHPKKCHRPFAAGRVPPAHGVALAGALTGTAFLAAFALSAAFGLTLLLYFLVTAAYTLHLKRIEILDVITLAALYTLRVLAGSVVMVVPISNWLAMFSLFFFLFLAVIKRCAELIVMEREGKTELSGRGYHWRDLNALIAIGAASGYVSVLVLALYINSPDVHVLYGQPQLLWLACPLLVHWISRVLLLTQRGRMHDDPVIFALTDRGSQTSGALLVAILTLGTWTTVGASLSKPLEVCAQINPKQGCAGSASVDIEYVAEPAHPCAGASP